MRALPEPAPLTMTDTASSTPNPIPPDALAALAPADIQRQAALSAQDAFARVFRLTVGEGDAARIKGVEALSKTLLDWAAQAQDDEASALRLALVIAGVDQWGLAYSQAFGLAAIPGLSELVGAVRNALDERAEARFQRHFEALDAAEGNAIDFKIELRRAIHLALWHAMIACESRAEADVVLSHLGGMMVGLVRLMPALGWRLVADSVAHIQIRCLAESLATDGVARDSNEALFQALARELPADKRDLVMAHAARSVIEWQQAARQGGDRVH